MEADARLIPHTKLDRRLDDAATRAWLLRVGSALLYGVSSLVITIVNKKLLTSYDFPSFLVVALGQMFATTSILFVARRLQIIRYPPFRYGVLTKIWPLPLAYLGNMIFGLGGTKELSIPMQIVLRRFSVLTTMVAEFYWLNVKTRATVQVTVYAMIAGSIVAAIDDLGFSFIGYTMVLFNNISTTASGIISKSKLNSRELNTFGLLFYNSLLMLPPLTMWVVLSGELDVALATPHLYSPAFLGYFVTSSVMGLVLAYSTLLCTKHNSALTTTVIGCVKSICTTYAGMFVGGDYVFSTQNFIGINISVIGSLAYTWFTFRMPQSKGLEALARRNI